MKYMTRIEPDAMIPKNSAFEKALSQQMYTLLRQDPLIAPEVLVRKLISTHYRGEENEFMPERIMNQMQQQMTAAPEGEALATPGEMPTVPQPVAV
jgi:hypothetical protein